MGINVMIVDDNEDICFSIKAGLESLNKGYKVITAERGKEAIDLLQKSKPDVILMDIMMPGLDGFDTSILIKEMPEFRNTPIIFLSAKTDDISKGTAGVIGEIFIEKPTSIENVHNTITKVLAK